MSTRTLSVKQAIIKQFFPLTYNPLNPYGVKVSMKIAKTLFIIFSLVLLQNCSEELTQEQELSMLNTKLSEIMDMADNESCEGKEFEVVAFGNKACGGPSRFIAYSKSIDRVKFIKLLGEYTEAEKAYNNKYQVFSTCDLLQVPQNVSCEGGELSYAY